MLIVSIAFAALFAFQTASLFVFPRADCDRWHGDETWLMREFHSQVTTGQLRYPEAEASVIGEGNSIVPSSMWLNAALYGIPSAIFYPHFDEVSIGRVVTLAIAVVLLIVLYVSSRRLGASRELAALCPLLLLSSRSFFITSHSARDDTFVGLGVLLAVLATHWAVRSKWSDIRSWILFGLASISTLVWNLHVSRISAGLVIFILLKQRRETRWKAWTGSAIGGAIGVGLLVIIYWAINGKLVLGLASNTQFGQTVRDIPLLQPFSPLIQFAELHTHLYQLANEAPFVLLAVLLALVTLGFRARPNAVQKDLAIATLLATAFWALTIRPLPYYLMHILPTLVLFAVVMLSTHLDKLTYRQWLYPGVAAVLLFLGLRDVRVAQANGETISSQVRNVSSNILKEIHQSGDIKPTVIAEIPLVNWFLLDRDIHFISPYFLIFPIDSTTPPEYLKRHQVRYVAVEGSHLILPSHFPLHEHGYDCDTCGVLMDRWVGTLNDNYRDYFKAFTLRPDTISLFRIQ